MAIQKCCKNCYHYEYSKTSDLCYYCKNQNFWNYQPKEELVRKSEREKIITDLEYEIQNFNEVRDRNTIDFIYSFIKELKEH